MTRTTGSGSSPRFPISTATWGSDVLPDVEAVEPPRRRGELPGFGPRPGGWDRGNQIAMVCPKGHTSWVPDVEDRICMRWGLAGLCALPLQEVTDDAS